MGLLHHVHERHWTLKQQRPLRYSKRCEDRVVKEQEEEDLKKSSVVLQRRRRPLSSSSQDDDPVLAAKRRLAAYTREHRPKPKIRAVIEAGWYDQAAAARLAASCRRREREEKKALDAHRSRQREAREARCRRLDVAIAARRASGGTFERGSCVLRKEEPAQVWYPSKRGWRAGPYFNGLVTCHDGAKMGNMHLFGTPPPLALQQKPFRTALKAFQTATETRTYARGTVWGRALELFLRHIRTDEGHRQHRRSVLLVKEQELSQRILIIFLPMMTIIIMLPYQVQVTRTRELLQRLGYSMPRRRGSLADPPAAAQLALPAKEHETLPTQAALLELGFEPTALSSWAEEWDSAAGDENYLSWGRERWANSGFAKVHPEEVPLLLVNASVADGALLAAKAQGWGMTSEAAAAFVRFVYDIVHSVTFSKGFLLEELERVYGEDYLPPLEEQPPSTLPNWPHLRALGFTAALVEQWVELFHSTAGPLDYTKWEPSAWVDSGNYQGFDGSKVVTEDLPILLYNATEADGFSVEQIAAERWAMTQPHAEKLRQFLTRVVRAVTLDNVHSPTWDSVKRAIEQCHGSIETFQPDITEEHEDEEAVLQDHTDDDDDDDTASSSEDDHQQQHGPHNYGDDEPPYDDEEDEAGSAISDAEDDDDEEEERREMQELFDLEEAKERQREQGDQPRPGSPRVRPTAAGVYDGTSDNDDASFYSD